MLAVFSDFIAKQMCRMTAEFTVHTWCCARHTTCSCSIVYVCDHFSEDYSGAADGQCEVVRWHWAATQVERNFCPCIILSEFNFFVRCCITDSTYRPILLLCSSFSFQLVLRLTPHPQSECSKCTDLKPVFVHIIVTLVATAFLIIVNILTTGTTGIG